MIEFDYDELRAAARRLGTDFGDHEQEDVTRLAAWMAAQVDQFLVDAAPLQPAPDAVRAVRVSGPEATSTTDPLNAIVRWVDVEAVEAAKTSDLLHGKRIGLKDLISVAGVPLSAANKIFDGFVPREDSPVARRVLEAGGHIVAMTNLEGMAWGGGSESGRWGACENPWDRSRSTAGSSGGSGAALFYDGIDITFGTDQGGSIRLPASWCGVLGLKPTWSLIPYQGIASHEYTFDHVGPMTRTSEDLALAMAAVSGRSTGDPRQAGGVPTLPFMDAWREAPDTFEGKTFGVLAEAIEYSDGSPEREAALDAFRAAVEKLRELGATVVEISIPEHTVGGSIIFGAMVESVATTLSSFGDGYHWSGAHSVETRTAVGKGLAAHGAEMPPAYRVSAALGELLRTRYFGTVYAQAQNAIPAVRAAYDAALETVDAIIMPTTPTTAMERTPEASMYDTQVHSFSMAVDTPVHNATGHPALSIPAAEAEGMPLGLMLVGRHFHDHELIALARTWEKSFGWFPENAPAFAVSAPEL
jgi:amidase